MFLISVVLSVSLTTIFANPFSPYNNRGNPRLLPQQEPLTTQGDQVYSPSMPQLSMEENHQMYPMPPPMMQGFQPPLPFNPINQQQLSILLMSSYARAMALAQLINMQNRYQLYQPNQYSDLAVNNYSPMPAPLPYAQQPQVDLQNNMQNEMLQEQEQQRRSQQQQESQQAKSQQQEILENRKIQREFNMEVERRERLMKIKAEENELENKQKEIERILRDEEEIEREEEKIKKQILEEEQKEREEKEKDLKLRQEEELRFKKIEEEKMKQNQENIKPKVKVIRRQRKQINTNKKISGDIIE